MSKRESLRYRINENNQKIQLFELNNNTYSELTIKHLRIENIKLKELMRKMNSEKIETHANP